MTLAAGCGGPGAQLEKIPASLVTREHVRGWVMRGVSVSMYNLIFVNVTPFCILV